MQHCPAAAHPPADPAFSPRHFPCSWTPSWGVNYPCSYRCNLLGWLRKHPELYHISPAMTEGAMAEQVAWPSVCTHCMVGRAGAQVPSYGTPRLPLGVAANGSCRLAEMQYGLPAVESGARMPRAGVDMLR
eukprot:scaffold198399_cov30-Tisochrysis_lutea.AAC.2